MKRRIAALITALALMLSLVGCGGPESKIDGLNHEFCSAFNHVDMEGVLECLEPSMAQTVEAVTDIGMGILSAVTGIDLNLDAKMMADLLKVYFDIVPEGGEYTTMSDFPKLSIDLDELELNEDETHAIGHVTVTAEMPDGTTETEEGTIEYAKIDGDWYFANTNFAQ